MKTALLPSCRCGFAFAVSMIVGFAAVPVARTATYTWDPSGDQSNTAGSGPWDTTTPVWNNGTADVPWSSNNNAVFSGADGTYTVTVANGITTGTTSFNVSGYTLIGASATTPGVLTIGSAGNTLAVATGKTLTIGANMTLNAPTYTDNYAAAYGTINVINGGKISGPSGAGLSGTVNVGAGSSVSYTSLLLSNATVTVNGAGAAFTALGSMGVQNSTVTITQGTFGTTTGNTGLSFSNSTVNLNGGTLLYGYGAGSNAGTTINFNGGTLQTGGYPVAFNGTDNPATKLIVQAGGVNFYTTGGGVTVSTVLQHDTSGPAKDGGITKTGANSLTLGVANTYTGGTTVGGGTLVANANGALGSGDAGVLAASVSLTIGTGVTMPFSNPLARLTLAGGGMAGVADNGYLNLTSGANITVGSLVLGTTVYTSGVFSSANFPEYFSGSGTLTVVPEPGSLALVCVLAGGFGVAARRARRR